LCRALLDTYLTRDDFEELLVDIDKNLNSIVESSVTLMITERRVVRIAKGEGWLGAVEAALVNKPDSPALKRWHQEYCAARPQTVPAVSAPAGQLMDSAYFDLAEIRGAAGVDLVRLVRRAAPPCLAAVQCRVLQLGRDIFCDGSAVCGGAVVFADKQ
jgi:hypothetical protein